MLEDWRLESIATINAEAERRRLEIAASVTKLRQMALAREKLDKEKLAARQAQAVQREAERSSGKVGAPQRRRGRVGIIEPIA
jgi:hypothetical protein